MNIINNISQTGGGKNYHTEDEVRDIARDILGLHNTEKAVANTGQLTTFNQLGFIGNTFKPDGWYLPKNTAEPAIVLETKNSKVNLANYKWEIERNIQVVQSKV